MENGMPHSVNASIASALAGVSRVTFLRRYLRAGLVKLDPDRRVPVREIERVTGKNFSCSDLVAAGQRLEPARRWQRDYARARGSKTDGRPA